MQRSITADARNAVRARGAVALVLLLTLADNAARAAPAREIGAPFEFAPRERAQLADAGALRIRGAVSVRASIDGQPVPREWSGLAWSEDDALLYVVSDAGWVLHLEPEFDGGQLRGLRLHDARRLTDVDGTDLPPGRADAEGLALLDADDGQPGNTRLLVAFEGDPVVAEHSASGRRQRMRKLPPPLRDVSRYAGRNHGLEALTWHPRHGLITAPERRLRGSARRAITLYGGDGQQWVYPVEDVDAQSITGFDTLPDGRLLAVERRYSQPWLPVVCTLNLLDVNGSALRIAPLAQFSSARGWPVDNFEAIAHFRGPTFFIVSDDNASPLQRTLLIHFEIVRLPPRGD